MIISGNIVTAFLPPRDVTLVAVVENASLEDTHWFFRPAQVDSDLPGQGVRPIPASINFTSPGNGEIIRSVYAL
jgi:hypothetical protein